MKIRVPLFWRDDPGPTEFVEIEASEVPGTQGTFMVHPKLAAVDAWATAKKCRDGGRALLDFGARPENGDDLWRVTHRPSGYAMPFDFRTRDDAVDLAQRFFAAAPAACLLSSPKLHSKELPAEVVAWIRAAKKASTGGMIPVSLHALLPAAAEGKVE
jgi:hypothetical protein